MSTENEGQQPGSVPNSEAAGPSIDVAPVNAANEHVEGTKKPELVADENAREPHPDAPGAPLGNLPSNPTMDGLNAQDSDAEPAPGSEPDAGPKPDGEQKASASPKGPPSPEPEFTLAETTLEYWSSLDEVHRIAYYNSMDEYFHNLLEDFRANANEAVRGYARFGNLSKNWRLALIVLTGGLALLNVLATSWPPKWPYGDDARVAFSFVAAIYAVILALLSNVESFFNFYDKKTSTRESRELYLDAFREFEMLRLAHVYPYGYDAQACLNFSRLYRRLVIKDLELRRKIMQLSETLPGGPAKV
jgi:hypothetical protein